MPDSDDLCDVGLYGLAVMGQNFALNMAEHGFKVCVGNRSPAKVELTVNRAKAEGDLPLVGSTDPADFVSQLSKPRKIVILVQAGKPVDDTIAKLAEHMEEGDIIIDGGNEWFPNTIRRGEELEPKGIHFIGMGISGGEEGARKGPSLMPGGPRAAFDAIEPILTKCAAQVEDGACTGYVGPIGAGNYVKMVHNGIEYGDMQLIAEVYDVLKVLLMVGGAIFLQIEREEGLRRRRKVLLVNDVLRRCARPFLLHCFLHTYLQYSQQKIVGMGNEEMAKTFEKWNEGELESYLIEITAKILAKHDDKTGEGYVVDYVLDKTGAKGTGRWTVQEAAERSVAAPTLAAALDARYLSAKKEERVAAESILKGPKETPNVSKFQILEDLQNALYSAKICSYAQGLAIIKATSAEKEWDVDLAQCAKLWKGGCIIRAKLLGKMQAAFETNDNLANLMVDPGFAAELNERHMSWRRVVTLCIASGIACPGLCSALNYYDTYRRGSLPANLTQAQRDFFGGHTYERIDREGPHHTAWTDAHKDIGDINTRTAGEN